MASSIGSHWARVLPARPGSRNGGSSNNVHDRKQGVRRRQINADDLRFLVQHVIDEAGILMAKAIDLAARLRGDEIVDEASGGARMFRVVLAIWHADNIDPRYE